MIVNDKAIYNKANKILKEVYGENALFREGQYEAIENTILNKRSLVVQKTGWGKSLVYFIVSKILKETNKGLTFIISPLLVLMDNQCTLANKIGLKTISYNSNLKENKEEVINIIRNNQCDIVFITPESLFSKDIQGIWSELKVIFFVIDEVHCISDWGHDFRLDYTKLNKIIKVLPSNVTILGTTATANDRVVNDLKKQLGSEVFISRGSLMRNNLTIQVLRLSSKAERYAWILDNINNLSGSGIIYCSTKHDCDYLSKFLNINKINSRSYHSDLNPEEAIEIESLFYDNKIKVIVSTVKLGMGYDKDDVSFVIHFQRPSNIISYYQQIGRAGRNIPIAHTFLMCGYEDMDIQNYFINEAFPTQEETDLVIKFIEENNGSNKNKIINQNNINGGRINKAIYFLENEGFIYKEKSLYYLSSKKYAYNKNHYDNITNQRKKELKFMNQLIDTKDCYNKFIVNSLDDDVDYNCGVCSNCSKKYVFDSKVNKDTLLKVQEYFNHIYNEILPRKRWSEKYDFSDGVNIKYVNDVGICLSRYNDPGYGSMVKEDRYNNKTFREELVIKSAEVIKEKLRNYKEYIISYVPSHRSEIVKYFSISLAKELGIKCITLLEKTNNLKRQKEMENSVYQNRNAIYSFKAINHNYKKIILIDDLVDSKWTFTVCGYFLMEKGATNIFPFALADSSRKEAESEQK